MKAKGVVLILLALAACAAASFAQTDAERDVRKLERAWLDAYEKNDVKAMNEIVADSFVITFPDGKKQTKTDIVEMLKRAPQPGQGGMRHHTEDVKSRMEGCKVVLTGRVISEYLIDGKAVSREESLYTDTYENRGGKWQVVMSILSDLKTAGKP